VLWTYWQSVFRFTHRLRQPTPISETSFFTFDFATHNLLRFSERKIKSFRGFKTQPQKVDFGHSELQKYGMSFRQAARQILSSLPSARKLRNGHTSVPQNATVLFCSPEQRECSAICPDQNSTAHQSRKLCQKTQNGQRLVSIREGPRR